MNLKWIYRNSIMTKKQKQTITTAVKMNRRLYPVYAAAQSNNKERKTIQMRL